MSNDFNNRTNYFYKETQTIKDETGEETSNMDYITSLNLETVDNSNAIRINLVNEKDECISFTTIMTIDAYKVLQKEQELHVSFDDFASQLKSLFADAKTNKLTIKLKGTAPFIELGFYTMTNLKEIKLLYISLERTALIDIITFFKNKSNYYLEQYQCLENKYIKLDEHHRNVLNINQTELQEVHKQLLHEKNSVETLLELKKNNLEEIRNLNMEMKDLKGELLNFCEDKHRNTAELLRRDRTIQALRKDIIDLKTALRYYITNYKRTDTNSVPIERYNRLQELYSATLADLFKYQVYLKQVLDFGELHKEENGRLRHEIENCIDTIAHMKTDLNILCRNEVILNEIANENNEVCQNIEELNNQIGQFRT